jgi:hypothetical protein
MSPVHFSGKKAFAKAHWYYLQNRRARPDNREHAISQISLAGSRCPSRPKHSAYWLIRNDAQSLSRLLRFVRGYHVNVMRSAAR